MPTAAEIDKRIDQLFQQWNNTFTPLFLAINDMKVEKMSTRIFQQAKNSDLQDIPLPARKRGVKSAGNSEEGEENKLVNGYTPAYARLKERVGRLNRPLELTGFLFREWTARPALDEGLSVSIVIDDSEAGKVEGLTKLYGDIFNPTDAEQAEMLEIHAELLTQSINDALIG